MYVIYTPNTRKCVHYSKNEKLIYTSPKQWKITKDIYEIKLILKDLPNVVCKLIAISSGDRLILNFFSTTGQKNVYSIVIQSLKYVNPFSNNLASRYMNLKEISHRYLNIYYIFNTKVNLY